LKTVRTNRVINCNVISDAELRKRGRGSYAEKVTTVDGISLSLVRWFDNRPVTFLSTLVGAQPVMSTSRGNKSSHAQEQVPCPKVVQIYNRHMGGVDLLDSLIGLYCVIIRSKKWYHCIFFHMLDSTVVNAWLLYKRCMTANASNVRLLRLHEFKALVAQGPCKNGKECEAGTSRKRGRPSSENTLNENTIKRSRPTQRPCSDVRYDGIGHWPEWRMSRQRCKQYSRCFACCLCKMQGLSWFQSQEQLFFTLTLSLHQVIQAIIKVTVC
jgi:Transposase IS4